MSRYDGSDIRAESPDEGVYNHAHRAFLQAFLSRSVMTVDEIKPVIAAVMSAKNPNRPRLEGDITAPDITSMLRVINLRLTPLDYEIRSTRDQRTKTLTYALVNTTSDPLTQLATTFTSDEIAYVKRVLDRMFIDNNTRNASLMAVTSMQAAQLAKVSRSRQSQVNGGREDAEGASQMEASVKGISMPEAETVLGQLIAQQFFQKSRGGYFSLAPRGLMELRSYLKETYNEPADEENGIAEKIRIRDCEGCREIVTVGLRCSDRACGVRWHDLCAQQYFNGQRGGGRMCPRCGVDWAGNEFVGERVAVGGQRRTTGAGGQSSQTRRDEYEDEDE
ncbi:hypothetical protein K505DRAFT_280960 [Melanomma pulvis-pyrius CBS 109.77]|uniref:Non-structural maintenance of chromosomes element 1 homolog n=1 Tax=Melanomma pulvis-pyrius CBS 109.77 TaxID=1314802 RepID=A0A6A6X4U1_9PLEO|nr:hypothetical protein K505DRAFT_280960 [Melanomma pulvis-pyrius CBS 109.77]